MLNETELLRDINDILNHCRTNGLTKILTTDIIRRNQGNYYNAQTSPQKSWNSKFGKFLKDNASSLRIQEIRKDVNTKDDNNNRTSCSEWEL
ncbi:hypothetical protein G9F72_024135 [Clostridium estertheticum]|uniref:hypothetical protein n=1 Tax=Clostridium estertheticum TaxID=238834 RepID=UPI0013E959FA|nr:hypothetical protein [Clostridium estertheticum]MBZ9689391.1 hypothetical protein [Clostridium estertheticum]